MVLKCSGENLMLAESPLSSGFVLFKPRFTVAKLGGSEGGSAAVCKITLPLMAGVVGDAAVGSDGRVTVSDWTDIGGVHED